MTRLNDLPKLEELLQMDPEWLLGAVTTEEASRLTGVPVATLVALRSRGGGPRFLKPAGTRSVRYIRLELYRWLFSGGHLANTAQIAPNAGVVDALLMGGGGDDANVMD
ncbi:MULTISPECIES: hypothetical protein [Alphaproteobacteria]|uniref:helix-turn-helix transcriptional regulator n=1 Tax=Alphaproteobacteria TaxID=28211 RepID=UPI003263128A